MDSTTVAIIADTAKQLGITASSAFTAFLFLKLSLHLIWAAVILILAFRILTVIRDNSAGCTVIDAWIATRHRHMYREDAAKSILAMLRTHDHNTKNS